MKVREASDETFAIEALAPDEPVLVDFFTTWCGPCKAMAPALEAVASALDGKVKVVKVDVGANPQTAAKYAVRGVPTLMIFRHGKAVARHVGALVQKDVLTKWIKDWTDTEAAGEVERRQTTSTRLANGLDVVVISDKRAPFISHMIWYRFGAADAPAGLSGLPYIVEQLTTNSVRMSGLPGAANLTPRQRFGNQRYFEDATSYRRQIMKDDLAGVMALEADRMVQLRVSEEDVAAASAAVDARLEEFQTAAPPAVRLEVEVADQLTAALFGAHPYGAPAVGWTAERQKITREDVIRFHERHYAPNNAVLVVSGNVTLEEVKQLAEATYGTIPIKAAVSRRTDQTTRPGANSSAIVLKDKDADGLLFRRSYLTPSHKGLKSGDTEAIELLAFIMGATKSGRLSRRLIDAGMQISSAVAFYRNSTADFGTLTLEVGARSADIRQIEAGVEAVIDDLRENPVTENELKDAKAALAASFDAAPQEHFAGLYAWALVQGGTLAEVDGWAERVAKVTAADVQRVAQDYFLAEHSATVCVVPEAVQDTQLVEVV